MNLSEGQQLGLTQLQSIEVESDYDFEIISCTDWKYNPDYCSIIFSLGTRCFEKSQIGFEFRPRERFRILIHKEFPFQLPSISFEDTRFKGKPHVQWGKVICLYQSVEVDYDPADGMYGIMERLDLWLKKAALGDLDPYNAPLHPPIAYPIKGDPPIIIPNINTPEINSNYWLGGCLLKELNRNTLIISDWSENNFIKDKFYGAVLLMNDQMPFEYPETLYDLIDILKINKVEPKSFLDNLGNVALHNGKSTGLYIAIGSAMRGFHGDRKQHLAVWYLEERLTRSIRSIYNTPIKSVRARQRASAHYEKLIDFSVKSKLDWCKVLDNRVEIITDRDQNTLNNFFKDKVIEIWGCGALGSHFAEIITRTRPKKVILIDNGIIKPGLLVRQLFTESDIGINKAIALKNRIEKIYSQLSKVEIVSLNVDVLQHIDEIDTNRLPDIIIDATASLRIFRKIDKHINNKKIDIPVLSFTINNNAGKAMIVYKSSANNAGLTDIIRQAKLRLCEKNDKHWLPEFFPDRSSGLKLIQPEPGCSDPTFIGSEADLSALSGLLINQAIKSITINPDKSKVVFISQELDDKKKSNFDQIYVNNYNKEQIILDPINGYKIFIPQNILEKIIKEIEKSDKKHNPAQETGGLIFGEWDDLTRSVYINEVSGPPADSKSSRNHFDCGVKGTKELNDKLKARYRGSIYFIGLWHSHPFGSATYSGEDKASMHLVVTKLSPPKSLLLIVAYDRDNYALGGFVFNKSQIN